MAYSRARFYSRRRRFRGSTAFTTAQIAGGALLFLVLYVLITQFRLDVQHAVLMLFILLGVIVIGLVGVGIFQWKRQQDRWRALEISQIDKLRGIEFEQYLAGLLRFHGFNKVTITPPQGDYGADLLGTFEGKRYAIQAKQYNNWKKVGVEAIYQVLGGEKKYDCEATMVITTGYFTPQALELSEKSKTVLIDRDQLLDMITKYVKK